LFEATGVSVSPNVLYFGASNYVDGLARATTTAYNWKLTLQGKKDFDPRRDTLVLDSFIGAPSNYDSRKFSEAEKKIETIKLRLKNLEKNPEALDKYLDAHPMDMALVKYYNKSTNQALRDVRGFMNDIREDRTTTPKEKKEQLDQFQPIQNAIKRDLVSIYNQMGDLENR
jgi:chaperonin cofactor prefoldin